MDRRKQTLRRFFCPRPPFVGAPQNTIRLPPPCAVYGGPLLKQMSRKLFQNEETRDGETAFPPMISRRPRLRSEQKLKQNSPECFRQMTKGHSMQRFYLFAFGGVSDRTVFVKVRRE
jgi:hypothetical protein